MNIKIDRKILSNSTNDNFTPQEVLTYIDNIVNIINKTLNLSDKFKVVCQELFNIFPLSYSNISLFISDKNKLDIKAQHSQNLSKDFGSQVLQAQLLNDGFISKIKKGQSVLFSKEELNPQQKQNDTNFHIDKLFSILVVPLIIQGNTIGAIFIQAKTQKYKFSQSEIHLLKTISGIIASAIEFARLNQKAENDLDIAERDLEIGSQIQSGFFPHTFPNLQGIEISTFFSPARQVSGDFYDVFSIKGTEYLCVVVADVCDKGVGSALFMVLLRTLIRSYSETQKANISIDDLLNQISYKVNNYIFQTHGNSNMFATLCICIIDECGDELFYVNGGHDPPILINDKGKIKQTLQPTGPAFGFSEDVKFDTGKINLLEGYALLIYTDGLTEARDAENNFYTEERLLRQFSQQWSSAFSIVKYLESDIYAHMGYHTQFDDITFAVIRKCKRKQSTVHEFTQRAHLSNLPFFRGFAVEACQNLNINNKVIESVKLAVDEICSNIIMHGFKDAEAGSINLILKEGKSELLVEVNDTGKPFNPMEFEPPELDNDINKREIGKLGVHFIKEMVDELNYKYNRGKNCLSLKIKY